MERYVDRTDRILTVREYCLESRSGTWRVRTKLDRHRVIGCHWDALRDCHATVLADDRCVGTCTVLHLYVVISTPARQQQRQDMRTSARPSTYRHISRAGYPTAEEGTWSTGFSRHWLDIRSRWPSTLSRHADTVWRRRWSLVCLEYIPRVDQSRFSAREQVMWNGLGGTTYITVVRNIHCGRRVTNVHSCMHTLDV